MFVFFVLLPTSADRAVAKPKAEKTLSPTVSVLREVSKKYRSTNVVQIPVDKKVTSELLGRTTEYQGTIYLSQGKFRWENETPEKSLLLFDGDTIWSVQYPPEDLGGPVQVAKAKLNKNTKSQIFISTLLGKDPIDKNFDIISEKTADNTLSVELKPHSEDLQVKELRMDVDLKLKIIKNISYKDDVDNLTVIAMKKPELHKKVKKELFKFKIPKDAQVTNL